MNNEHPLTALIAAHLLGGTTGLDMSDSMTDSQVEDRVGVALRVAAEIEKQVAEYVAESECLIVGHLLGGTKGLDLKPTMTSKEIEDIVEVAVRVLKEMDRQAKQTPQAPQP